MLKLKRIIDNEFPKNFWEGKREEWELELLKNEVKIKKGTLEKHSFSSSRWKDAKDQLIKETGGRCAYCEVRFNTVAYGDVEHYRPKSIYWWLAYCYENYLPSCQLCNQKYKKDKFPIKNTRVSGPKVFKSYTTAKLTKMAGKISPNAKSPDDGYPYNTFYDEYKQERPFSINPYYEDPADFFAYEVDDNLREVLIVSLKSNLKKYINASEVVYGINRKELREDRYFTFFDYRLARTVLNDSGSSGQIKQMAQQAIDFLKDGRGGFVGMINYFEGQDFDSLFL